MIKCKSDLNLSISKVSVRTYFADFEWNFLSLINFWIHI